jgi:hypothetical protein
VHQIAAHAHRPDRWVASLLAMTGEDREYRTFASTNDFGGGGLPSVAIARILRFEVAGVGAATGVVK